MLKRWRTVCNLYLILRLELELRNFGTRALTAIFSMMILLKLNKVAQAKLSDHLEIESNLFDLIYIDDNGIYFHKPHILKKDIPIAYAILHSHTSPISKIF